MAAAENVWYCPQCGEPCGHESGVHPECQEAFAKSVIEDDFDNLSGLN